MSENKHLKIEAISNFRLWQTQMGETCKRTEDFKHSNMALLELIELHKFITVTEKDSEISIVSRFQIQNPNLQTYPDPAGVEAEAHLNIWNWLHS